MTSNGVSIDGDRFKILVNAEEQYSIWPADLDAPTGWTVTGAEGDKQACMDWVDEHWTDMRPLSLRKAMERDGV